MWSHSRDKVRQRQMVWIQGGRQLIAAPSASRSANGEGNAKGDAEEDAEGGAL